MSAFAACRLGLVLITGIPIFAGTITIGAPGDPNNGDCAPFGCAVEYQQVYGSGLFSGPMTITGLTFFNNNFVPGEIASANYSVYLSTTSAAVNSLDAAFANNLGQDNALFFSGALGGTIGPSNQFTITGTPFAYDPSNGNLLLWITSDSEGLEFSVFLDFTSGAAAETFSRAYSFDASGIAGFLESNAGLVTQFTYDQAETAVPEPEARSYLAMGLGALCVVARLRTPIAVRGPSRNGQSGRHLDQYVC